MDLSTGGIYASSIKALRQGPLIYVLLFFWGLLQGVLLFALLWLGGAAWAASTLASFASDTPVASAYYNSLFFMGFFLVILTILSATTRAGVLAYGAIIRRGGKARAVDFFRGIIRYTIPLFLGGLVVGMLTAIPALGFMLIAKFSLSDAYLELFTSGWNYGELLRMLAYLWNVMLAAGMIHLLIFFWIAPWDEMVVLYNLPFPEAIWRSFRFVFSKRHFVRVILLILFNVVITQAALISTNLSLFMDTLDTGILYAWSMVMINASQSFGTSFLQYLLVPFFAYTQLYLLPWPAEADREADTKGKIK